MDSVISISGTALPADAVSSCSSDFSGAFFIQHRDHGSYTGWSEPNYGLSDLNGLTNDKFTFVNSTNCLTGAYDYYAEVFAEKFYRIDNGAWGANAASDVSYSFVNDTYIWGMWDCLYPARQPMSIGERGGRSRISAGRPQAGDQESPL